MAQLLEVARQLMTVFDKYTSIPQIMGVRMRLEDIQSKLRKHVHHAFLDIGHLVETVADSEAMARDLPGNMRALSDASLLVDALGLDMRRDVLDEFVCNQLNPYKKLFGPNMAYHTIEHTERRWAWFRRLLKTVELKFSAIWPVHWEVPKRLCAGFVALTREHTVSMLIVMESDERPDVSVLLRALQTTLRFEQEMEARFAMDPRLKKQSSGGRGESNPFDEEDAPPLPRAREEAGPEEFRIRSAISDEYDRFLGSYVVLERQNLEEMLDTLRAAEDTVADAQDKDKEQDDYAAPSRAVTGVSRTNVYDSSIQMFVFIKNSIKRCTTLTTGVTFLSLSHEFRHALRRYHESLKSKAAATGRGVNAETTLCYLINTAEYCGDVVPRLEAMVRAKIKAEHAGKVDYGADADMFLDLVAELIGTLAAVVVGRAEPALRQMSSTSWGALTQVSEESAYVLQLQTALGEAMAKIESVLSEVYFKNLCAKVAHEVLHKYLDAVMRQRGLTELATQQLLLDVCSLRALVLGLPRTNQPHLTEAASSFGKVVVSRVNQIDMVLKVLAAPAPGLIDLYLSLSPEGKGSAPELLALMTARGMKKAEQQAAVDAYQASHPGALKATAASTTSDSFPPLVSLAGFSSQDQGFALSIPASMRLATADLSFSVGNLKWNSK